MKQDKPPLRKYLVGEIEREGYLSLDTITNIAITFGHKQDTARRILNKDMSGNIEPVYNDKHQIKGYKVREENVIMSASEEEKRTNASTESREATQEVCRTSETQSERTGQFHLSVLF